LSKSSSKELGRVKRHISSARELQRTCSPALPFSPVKIMRKCNTVPKGNQLAASDHSSLVVQKSQARPGSPAKVPASIMFNKIVQQLGIVRQL